jgi:hypothetical protein
MARYVATMKSSFSAPTAFSYLADVANFADWDPSITRVSRITSGEPRVGAAYDIDVRTGPRTTTMRYETTEFTPPRRFVIRAQTPLLLSVDEVLVEPDGTGSVVTYDAQLTLKGAARVLDPLLTLVFRRIGDRAAAGLRRELRAETVAA